MTALSSERSWARSSWTIIGGVAVASSAATTLCILGIQRLHRRHRRFELEEDIRRATKGHSMARGREELQKGEVGTGEGRSEKGESHEIEFATPKYLATLAASQEGVPSQSSTPRPNSAAHSTSSNNFQHHLSSRASMQMRPSLSTSSSTRNVPAPLPLYDETLIREQLSRNYSFLGEEAMSKLRNSFVIVVGAGGVGSWCALMLLRSGIGKLRLIDFDQVSLSSLNRHACANLADVGRPKVVVCKEHFAHIAPWAEVETQVEIFRGADAARLLGPSKDELSTYPTYVVDAIDNLDTKVDLLAYCYKNKIKCFSSMGAGAKADPGQIQIADLNMTAEDPLARKVRRSLRARNIWTGGAMLSKQEIQKTCNSKDSSDKTPKAKGRRENKEKPVSSSSSSSSSQAKKEADHKAALDKLESKAGQTAAKKLESSGRGADLYQITKQEPTSTPINGTEGLGFSRYSTSRRTSTASSRGSSQFFSPLATPEEEKGPPLLDAAKVEEQIKEKFPLPESGQSSLLSEEQKSDEIPQRPSLATLLSGSSSSEADSSRRMSSLKELMAEDVRSSQSGNLARRSISGIASCMEDLEEEAIIVDTKRHDEEPFKIMCVYSNEKSDTRLLPLDEEEFQKGNVEELAALEDFRVRILPVLGPLPAMFGLAAATYVICDIGGRELETVPWKNRRKTYERVREREREKIRFTIQREALTNIYKFVLVFLFPFQLWTELEAIERRYPLPGSGHDKSDVALGPRRIPWTVEDVGYVFEEVYRARSVVPPHETLLSGKMLRWDSTLPLSVSHEKGFSSPLL